MNDQLRTSCYKCGATSFIVWCEFCLRCMCEVHDTPTNFGHTCEKCKAKVDAGVIDANGNEIDVLALAQRAEAAERREHELGKEIGPLYSRITELRQMLDDREKEWQVAADEQCAHLTAENTRLKDRVAELEREMARGMSVAYEREACAKIVQGKWEEEDRSLGGEALSRLALAAAIRARGDK